MSKANLKTEAIDIPSDQKEAEAYLLRIGNMQNDIQRIEADMNDRIARIKAQYEEKALVVNAEIKEKFQALHAWAEANKSNLLSGKAKTAKLASGELSWRTATPSVSVRKQDDVIRDLKAAGMDDFVRTKEEVNKDAILSSDENKQRATAIKGISINQKETFSAKPFSTEIECIETVAKSSKKVA